MTSSSLKLAVFFFFPRCLLSYLSDYSQTPTRLSLAVSENHSLVKKKLIVSPANADVLPAVSSLYPTRNMPAFVGYQLLCVKRSLFS